jgi:hypothetical protein
MLRILFLFTFIMPIILWAQPPVKDIKQKSAALKKETTSSFSKKRRQLKLLIIRNKIIMLSYGVLV